MRGSAAPKVPPRATGLTIAADIVVTSTRRVIVAVRVDGEIFCELLHECRDVRLPDAAVPSRAIFALLLECRLVVHFGPSRRI